MNLTKIINNQLARIGIEVNLRRGQGLYKGLFKGELKRISQNGFLLVTYSDTNEGSLHFQISVGKHISEPLGYLTKSNVNLFNSNYGKKEFPITFINEGDKLIHVSSGANIEFTTVQDLVKKVNSLLKQYIDVLENGEVEDLFFKYDTEAEIQRMMA